MSKSEQPLYNRFASFPRICRSLDGPRPIYEEPVIPIATLADLKDWVTFVPLGATKYYDKNLVLVASNGEQLTVPSGPVVQFSQDITHIRMESANIGATQSEITEEPSALLMLQQLYPYFEKKGGEPYETLLTPIEEAKLIAAILTANGRYDVHTWNKKGSENRAERYAAFHTYISPDTVQVLLGVLRQMSLPQAQQFLKIMVSYFPICTIFPERGLEFVVTGNQEFRSEIMQGNPLFQINEMYKFINPELDKRNFLLDFYTIPETDGVWLPNDYASVKYDPERFLYRSVLSNQNELPYFEARIASLPIGNDVLSLIIGTTLPSTDYHDIENVFNTLTSGKGKKIAKTITPYLRLDYNIGL